MTRVMTQPKKRSLSPLIGAQDRERSQPRQQRTSPRARLWRLMSTAAVSPLRAIPADSTRRGRKSLVGRGKPVWGGGGEGRTG